MQRKRGDGGRFFSPKEKDDTSLSLSQVRNHVEQKCAFDASGFSVGCMLPSEYINVF